ncbi:hypothetical protein HYH03_015418 [Edaphochlamys debaryana]|uniref:WW domain-containing protein n=1 Tax=Edaphochlamys debaryana TaxID=47281 RepID=A0A835XLV7_9CHLO|nr:hypothetical protein HYH03_015418 [Edaphochlamys debaryana]|eukprot:KAG2485835.1 hypothetical protein HYH03_015418 [Edaphochlamys debaryana]
MQEAGRRRGLLALQAALLLLLARAVAEEASQAGAAADDGTRVLPLELQQEWYFFNEVTGAVQLEDPGSTPFEDPATGQRYWLDPEGRRLEQDPHREKYAWSENWSSNTNKPFYFNRITRESTWEQPPDLAWRRLPRTRDDSLDLLGPGGLTGGQGGQGQGAQGQASAEGLHQAGGAEGARW